MAKYKIIPSSRTIVQSPISIGHKAEKGVEAIEFDLTAWVEMYGSGTATIIMKRWGDDVPYPVALKIGEDNKATWTLSDMDTAKAGMAYAQLNYIVGDEVVKKSDIYTFRVMDSLTGEGEPPEAYESWLEHLTHIAAEAMAEVLDIEGIVTDKTLTIDGGIADAKTVGDELGAINKSLGEVQADLGDLQEGGYIADAQQIQTKISAWLAEHPEATTTVQDGSITMDKLNAVLQTYFEGYASVILPLKYHQGGISNASGDEYDSATNVRTNMFEVEIGEKIYITNRSDFDIYAHEYTDLNTYKGVIRLATNTYIPSAKYVRFHVSTEPAGENITPNDISFVFYTDGNVYDVWHKLAMQNYATPEMYGAAGDGTTDDSWAINAILADRKTLFLPSGREYRCDSDVYTPTNGVFNICGLGTLLLNDASLKLQNITGAQTRDLNISKISGITVREISQNSEKPCIHIVKGSRINMNDIMVYDGFIGIKADTGTIGLDIHDIRIDNSFIDNKTRIGLYVNAGDSTFSNITIREYKIGMDVITNTNFFYKVHPWIEDFNTIYPGSICYKLESSEGSIGNYYSAYLDSYETPILKTGKSWDKFYGVRILNHPSNTISHPIFTSTYSQARISFDVISLTNNSQNLFTIPKNCFFDNVNGINDKSLVTYSQVSFAEGLGLSGELYGRLTNSGLIINGRFKTDTAIPANTAIILFNGETSGFSFNLQNFTFSVETYDSSSNLFLKTDNYSQIRTHNQMSPDKTYYINVIIPLANRI